MSAYVEALKMLARRELSERQVRQRLARKGHDDASIEDAVARLKAERALDDTRVAAAIARTQSELRRRGRARVAREVESAGIAGAVARRAVDEAFASIDPDAQLDACLSRRLRGGRAIADDREFARLYRYLIGQGFESGQVMRALRARAAKPPAEE
ncbi:MAG TPA: RecX family transcriptional regulator [Vicinamibacterales bacterium]|nr:RecX family transcriptional regulator [Vicinamibacterales bacterium]